MPISLDELFSFPSIRGVTEHFVHSNPGDIPVYGGRKTGIPTGYIADNVEEVKYFENCLAWNRQGSVGYVFLHDHKFTTTDDHRPMHLKREYIGCIDLEYLRIQIQAMLLSSGFVWGKTAGKNKIKDIYIDLPIDENGNIDIIRQKELVSKYVPMVSSQKRLNDYRKLLKNIQIELNNDYEYKEVLLTEESFFSLEIGKRLLKKNILKKGVPVYSANVNNPFGYVEQTTLNSLDKSSLIWGIDGNFDWAYVSSNTIFEITDHCGRLQIKNPDILIEYVFFKLREEASTYGFNRSFRASLANIKSVSVKIPINAKGNFDISLQERMIEKYRELDDIKRKLEELIAKVLLTIELND